MKATFTKNTLGKKYSAVMAFLLMVHFSIDSSPAQNATMVPLSNGPTQTSIPQPGTITSLDSSSGISSSPTPSVESGFDAVKLSASGAFTLKEPRVGDSLDYIITVEWQDTEVPVFVLAPDSLSFSGFKVLGQSTVHKKVARGNDIHNHTEFIFHIRANIPGSGKASSIKLRYQSGVSQNEEAFFVSTSLIDILPAPVNIFDQLWFKILAGLIAFGAVIGIASAAYKTTVKMRKKNEVIKTDWRQATEEIKTRLRSAMNSPDASKEILLSMESISIKYLAEQLYGKTQVAPMGPGANERLAAPEKFDPLLDKYFAKNNSIPETENLAWEKLRALYRHAHFAGGYKEPHELQDAFRTFKVCLKIIGEDEHE